MVQCDPTNRSSYNSLQGKLCKRFSRGLQFLASYTFGKSLDYAGSAASGGGAVGNPQSVTLFDAEPRALGLRREAPLRAQLGLGAALRRGPRPRRAAAS